MRRAFYYRIIVYCVICMRAYLCLSVSSRARTRCIRGHCVVVPSTMAGLLHDAAQQYHQTEDFSTVLSIKTVQLYYETSSNRLGCRVRIRRQWAWGNVVAGLHYYASRLCGVPVWCIRLRWPSNPWELTQLSPNLCLACTVCNDFSEVDC